MTGVQDTRNIEVILAELIVRGRDVFSTKLNRGEGIKPLKEKIGLSSAVQSSQVGGVGPIGLPDPAQIEVVQSIFKIVSDVVGIQIKMSL